jgi:hypothetical protein
MRTMVLIAVILAVISGPAFSQEENYVIPPKKSIPAEIGHLLGRVKL